MDTLPNELIVYISSWLGAEDLLAFMLAHRTVREFYTSAQVHWDKFAALVRGPFSTRMMWLATANKRIAARIARSHMAVFGPCEAAFLTFAAIGVPTRDLNQFVSHASHRQQRLLLRRAAGTNPLLLAVMGFPVDLLAKHIAYRTCHMPKDVSLFKMLPKLFDAYVRVGKIKSAANLGWTGFGIFICGIQMYRVLRVEAGHRDVATLDGVELAILIARGYRVENCVLTQARVNALVAVLANRKYAAFQKPIIGKLCRSRNAAPTMFAYIIECIAAQPEHKSALNTLLERGPLGDGIPRQQLAAAIPSVLRHMAGFMPPNSIRRFFARAGTPFTPETLTANGLARVEAVKILIKAGVWDGIGAADVFRTLHCMPEYRLPAKLYKTMPDHLKTAISSELTSRPQDTVAAFLAKYIPVSTEMVVAHIRAEAVANDVNKLVRQLLHRWDSDGTTDVSSSKRALAEAFSTTRREYRRARELLGIPVRSG